MLNFVVALIVLSLTFSAIAVSAFALRKKLFCGREGMMYPFWIIILAISVFPLRLDVDIPYATDGRLFSDFDYVIVEPDWLTATKSGIITPSGKFVPAVSSVGFDSLRVGQQIRRFLSESADEIANVAMALFILWLAGAVISFSRVIWKYKQAKRVFLENSHACTNRRLLDLCEDLCKRMKINKKVSVRVFDMEALASPCVLGVTNPVLFVDSGWTDMGTESLEYVLTHEMTHIKRFDVGVKLFCMLAAAVHWFNPVSHKVVDAVMEDCELSCDYGVLKLHGNSVSSAYMNTILDIAKRCSDKYIQLVGNRFDVGLFALRRTAGSYLKRRYANMKNFKKDRMATVLASVFCAVSFFAVSAAVSSCANVNETSLDTAIVLDAPFDAMIRAYYDLGPDDGITAEMVDGIETLAVTGVRSDDRLTVEFAVNGEFTASGFMSVIPKNYYETVVMAKLESGSTVGTPSAADKFSAFYTSGPEYVSGYVVDSQHDGDDPVRSQLTELLGAMDRYEGFYILDPNTTQREADALRKLLFEAGLYDAWTLESQNLDCSSLGYFSNLESISFNDVTPVAYTFPENVELDTVVG